MVRDNVSFQPLHYEGVFCHLYRLSLPSTLMSLALSNIYFPFYGVLLLRPLDV